MGVTMISRIIFGSLAVLVCLNLTSRVLAAPKVVLAAAERRPYIGETLPNRGYVHQIVKEAFEREGLEVEIQFFPQARARAIARNGGVDGLLPVHGSSEMAQDFILSAPFPGDQMGLLKRKDRHFDLQEHLVDQPAKLLEQLTPFRIGVVRGGLTAGLVDQSQHLQTEQVSSDVLNLEKLYRNRIDLALMDKYTAADLMVSQLPHMIGQLDFVQGIFAKADFHIAFSKERERATTVRDAFDRGLRQLITEGRLQKILAYHGLAGIQRSSTNKRTLRIGAVANPHLLTLKRMSPLFEQQNPDIELQWLVLDEPILRLRTQSDLAISEGLFDVMAIGPYEAKNWAERGWLTAIDRFPAEYSVGDLITPVRQSLSFRDVLYALPLYAESSMTYFRKDLFKKAGIQMPESPSYVDIRDFAAKIHDPENRVYGICLRGNAGWGANMALVTTMVNTFGGRWFDLEWNPVLDTKPWHQALSFYRELLQQYGPPEPDKFDYNRILELFAEGRCGIWIDATSFAEALSDPLRSKVHDKLGWTNAPTANTPIGARWLWAWGLSIPESSKAKEASMRFILWATSRDYIQGVAQAEGQVAVPPGTRHSTYAAAYHEAVPFGASVYEAINAANPAHPTLEPVPYQSIQYVDIPEFASMGTRVGEKVKHVLKGELSVEQALQQSQVLVREQMNISGYRRHRR